MPAMTRAAISWSAGKDSCLALLRARASGLQVTDFLTMCEADGRSKSHALPPEIVAAQVAALGGPWWPVRVPDGDPGAYARCFDDALARLRAAGCSHMVFGDIDLQAHRDWIEPRCVAAGLQPVFPMWGHARAALAREIIEAGIRARVVCVDTARLDAAFCGRDYDAALLADLPAGVCPCGEEGEFHTLVTDAPGMSRRLAVERVALHPLPPLPPLRRSLHMLEELRLRDRDTRSSAARCGENRT